MAISIARHRFTVDEYYKMAEIGILTRAHRVELIGGEIIDKAPFENREVACVDRLSEILVLGLIHRAIVRIRSPLRLDDYSEPEPDIVMLRERDDFYAAEVAGPDDTLLVVEVADSSEHYDRHVKVPLYARSGIREVWLVDVTARNVTVYRQPEGSGYAEAIVAKGTDELSLLAFPEITVTADRILG